MKRKLCSIVLSMAMVVSLTACGSSAVQTVETASENSSAAGEPATESTEAGTAGTSTLSAGEVTSGLSRVDMSKWLYDSDQDIYYQTGLSYCENPVDTDYETMGFFVPGAYFNAVDNGDGTYTCTINATATVGGYTAATAPVIVPVNTPGYAAMNPPTDTGSSCGYGDISSYTDAGFVMAFAGCRGRDAGAPGGVTDLKAAIRYTRYNEGVIPGDMTSVFSEGMSGGGAQSALLGSSGDSSLYDSYLTAIGAVKGVSDAVKGSMCWCPITNLDEADEAYEWNLGSTRTTLTDDEKTYSDGMAAAFAKYINAVGLKDKDGNTLTLEKSENGIYQSGSYYDYLMNVVETSLNNFLSDTTFPYTVEENTMKATGGGAPAGMDAKGGSISADKTGAAGTADQTAEGTVSAAAATADYSQKDNITRSSSETAAVTISGTYETVQDYIDALNAPYTWVTYDADTNTASITSLADFTRAVKVATKGIAAFDELDAGQGENTLFGYGDGNGAHFDSTLAELVKGSDYEAAFTEDLAKTDSEGNTVDYRVNMYNPMYYMSDYYTGYKTSNVAKYWRIRTGIDQGDTALCTEVDLALAAENYSSDNQVDFATVWGLANTTAERSGDYVENCITWINDCMKDSQ